MEEIKIIIKEKTEIGLPYDLRGNFWIVLRKIWYNWMIKHKRHGLLLYI